MQNQQKAGIAQTKAATAQMYVDMQAIDPSEVRKKLADSAEFDVESMLDDYTPEELEANAPKGEEGGEGGDPMAAMMGGATEGAPGGEMPVGMPPEGGQMPAEQVSNAEGNTEPDGNAPVAAPDATRLPQDMTEGNAPERPGEAEKRAEKQQAEEIPAKPVPVDNGPIGRTETQSGKKEEENEDGEGLSDRKKYGGVGVLVVADVQTV